MADISPSNIEALVLDIDGVLTDGTEQLGDCIPKSVFLRDIDSLVRAKKEGIRVAFLTGEDEAVAGPLVQRCGGGEAVFGSKNKLEGLEQLLMLLGVPAERVCYVGDADRDVDALKLAAVGAAPADAAPRAQCAAGLILRNSGGHGAVAEVVDFLLSERRRRDLTGPLVALVEREAGEALKVHQAFLSQMSTSLLRVILAITECAERGRQVFLFGNGGSAADAQHVVAELVGAARRMRIPIAAEALTTNTSVLTALGNDIGFDEVFACQVEALARTGDVVVGISTSAASTNVIGGLEAAVRQGATTIGFTGSESGLLGPVCELIVSVPASTTARIQELHILAWHIVCAGVEEALHHGP